MWGIFSTAILQASEDETFFEKKAEFDGNKIRYDIDYSVSSLT
jgi:hypothetical protein